MLNVLQRFSKISLAEIEIIRRFCDPKAPQSRGQFYRTTNTYYIASRLSSDYRGFIYLFSRFHIA